MKLFIDDERDPIGDGWTVCRSSDEVFALIGTGLISYISFDHDLGDGVPNGMEICKWLVACDMVQPVFADDFNFYVHSQNPVGAENIRSYLRQYLKIKSS